MPSDSEPLKIRAHGVANSSTGITGTPGFSPLGRPVSGTVTFMAPGS
jgi:hypothetical protein